MKAIRHLAAIAMLVGVTILLAGHPAAAGAPEVKFDPVTGIDLPNRELEMALAEIEGHVRHARRCWQCAPWITSSPFHEMVFAGPGAGPKALPRPPHS